MKQSNRLLVTFGAVLGVLAIAAVILVIARGRETVTLFPETEPAGIVQRYLQAVQLGDYEGSLKYLAQPTQTDRGDIMIPSPYPVPGPYQQSNNPSWRATLGATRVLGERSEVDITVHVFRPGGPFADPVQTFNQTFFLVRQDGAWRIENPVGLWWLY